MERIEIPKKEVKITLYSPHTAQIKLHESEARFRIIAAGRRFGKSLMCANEALKLMLEKPGSRIAWVSPVWRQVNLGSDPIYHALRNTGLIEQVRRGNGQIIRISLKNGSLASFFSATNPEAIRGHSFDLVVMDEFAFTPRDVWEAVMRPTLADTQGKAILISTPFGRGLFYELYQAGQDPKTQDEMQSFHFPTAANPFIAAKEIEHARRTMPEDLFRQEYLAEFLESGAGVFRKVDECIRGELMTKGVVGRNYVMGVDFARQRDFTVVTVLDRDERQLVYFDRFSKVDWSIQLARIDTIAKKFFNPKIWVDATSQGDPLCEQMAKMGMRVNGYNMNSNLAKNALIENLSAEMEQGRVWYPAISELVAELKMFQYQISEKSHKILYSAPERRHDDTVVSLGLAIWGCRSRRAFEQFKEVAEKAIREAQEGPKTLTEEDYRKAQLNWVWNHQTRGPEYRS